MQRININTTQICFSRVMHVLDEWVSLAMHALHVLKHTVVGNNTNQGILDYLSVRSHYDSLSRGVIDTRDLIYFGSFILAGLVLSQTMLSKRNWHK